MRILLMIAIVFDSAIGPAPTSANTLATNYNQKWSIYRNQGFGFSIKYPSSWQLNTNDGNNNPILILYPRNPKPHEFYITISAEDRTLDQIRAGFAEFTRVSPVSRFKEQEIVFANRKAYQFTRSDNPGFYAVYIPFSNKLYLVAAARFDIPEVRTAVRTCNFARG